MNTKAEIGKTGIEINRIGFGAGVVGNTMMYPHVTEEMGRTLIDAVLQQDIQLIDTAFLYGMGRSEELIGEAIRTFGKREQLVLSTKASANIQMTATGIRVDNCPAALRQSVEDSLRRLQTDHLDLFFVHFPNSDTPLHESAGELDRLRQEGKIRAIGASNLNMAELQDFNADGYMDVFQTEYSLLNRQAEQQLIPYCLEHTISVIPIYPLASGLLAGHYTREQTFHDVSRMNNPMFQREAYLANLERVDALKSLASDKQVSLPQLALAWLLNRPGVDLIIPGATRPDQLASNMRTLDVVLSSSDMDQLDMLSR